MVVDSRRIYDPETFVGKMGFAAIDLGNKTSLRSSNETGAELAIANGTKD